MRLPIDDLIFWLDTGKASQIKVIRLPSSKIEPEQSYLVMEHAKPILGKSTKKVN